MKRVFISYAHEDVVFRDALVVHLDVLCASGIIANWHDGKIQPGQDWKTEIERELQSADVIVLLVSANFLASKSCQEFELGPALRRWEESNVSIIPVIVRACDWEATLIGQLQALPAEGRPVGTLPHPDDAWTEVVRRIRAISTSASPVPKSHPPPRKRKRAPDLPSVEDTTDSRRQARRRLQLAGCAALAIIIIVAVVGTSVMSKRSSSPTGMQTTTSTASTSQDGSVKIEDIPMEVLAREFVATLLEDQATVRRLSRERPDEVDPKDLLLGSPFPRVMEKLLAKYGYSGGYGRVLREKNELINRLIAYLHHGDLVIFPVSSDQTNRLNSATDDPLRAMPAFHLQSSLADEMEWAKSHGPFAARISSRTAKTSRIIQNSMLRNELSAIEIEVASRIDYIEVNDPRNGLVRLTRSESMLMFLNHNLATASRPWPSTIRTSSRWAAR